MLVASGTVVAGVDLSALSEGDVQLDEERRSVTLALPSSTVLASTTSAAGGDVKRRDSSVQVDRHLGLH